MPCTYDEFPHERAAREDKVRTAAVTKAVAQATASLEAMLCSASRELEERGYDFDKNPALSVWWHEHKLKDAQEARDAEVKAFIQRSISEALAKPLGQLTAEEKALLKEHKYI